MSILFINACAPMEDLSFEEKMRASDFAQTMNAIEGIPTTEETKQGISAWYLGEIDFLSLYEATLRKYGFPVEVPQSALQFLLPQLLRQALPPRRRLSDSAA